MVQKAIAFHFGRRYQALLLGASPSGKASVFGIDIPRFESWRPSQSPNPPNRLNEPISKRRNRLSRHVRREHFLVASFVEMPQNLLTAIFVGEISHLEIVLLVKAACGANR